MENFTVIYKDNGNFKGLAKVFQGTTNITYSVANIIGAKLDKHNSIKLSGCYGSRIVDLLINKINQHYVIDDIHVFEVNF